VTGREHAALERIAALVGGRSGIHLPPERIWLLERRVEERRQRRGDRLALQDYAALLEGPQGSEELGCLVELVRVGETRFFRLGDQQRALRRVCLPELSSRREAPLRIWCAGCASGEEPYTVAMIVDDWSRTQDGAPGFEVLATDLSADALSVARAGRYSRESLAGVPASLLERCFEPDGEQWRVRPEVASRVRFQAHNLVDQPYPGGFDLVFCRNVLIYFERATREAVARRLADSITMHGFLFLGEGEILQPPPSSFQMLRTPDGLIYQRTEAAAAERPAAPAPSRPPEQAPDAPPAPPAAPGTLVVRLQGNYDDGQESALAAELRPALQATAPLVVVDLDGAVYLGDRCASLLRRLAGSLHGDAGPASRLVLVASRPGPVRWIHRHREQLRGIRHCRSLAEAGEARR